MNIPCRIGDLCCSATDFFVERMFNLKNSVALQNWIQFLKYSYNYSMKALVLIQLEHCHQITMHILHKFEGMEIRMKCMAIQHTAIIHHPPKMLVITTTLIVNHLHQQQPFGIEITAILILALLVMNFQRCYIFSMFLFCCIFQMNFMKPNLKLFESNN